MDHPRSYPWRHRRNLREVIERAPHIHLCRSEECTQDGEFHCKAYAAIDADAVIDLGAY